MSINIYESVFSALSESDPTEKCKLTSRLYQSWQDGRVNVEPSDFIDNFQPGIPEKPKLVHPRELPQRKMGSLQGQAALIHAIAHIEFNAINLALDAIWRFRNMPTDYYVDWLKVSAEEAKHFGLLSERLEKLGYRYGDFSAHNGLWDMAMRTAHDVLHRMALIPRAMEARGLDVTPGMIKRFDKIGDTETVEILTLILQEEIGHVEAGSRWFRYLCGQRDLDADQTYVDLMQHYLGSNINCPTHLQARLQAGFSEKELNRLQQLCS